MQQSFPGVSQQRGSGSGLWRLGQALAGSRLEDGLDPHPRPEPGLRIGGPTRFHLHFLLIDQLINKCFQPELLLSQ